jgi:hypothetical protein
MALARKRVLRMGELFRHLDRFSQDNLADFEGIWKKSRNFANELPSDAYTEREETHRFLIFRSGQGKHEATPHREGGYYA